MGPVSYQYSLSQESLGTSKPIVYLDYNEYHGDVLPDIFEVYKDSQKLLSQYHRPSSNEIERKLSEIYSKSALPFNLTSGADHGIEEVLTYCRNYLQVRSFYSYYQTTYDHFYLFAHKLGYEQVEFKDADLIYICCPNNPDGDLLTPSEIKKIVEDHSQKYFILDMSYLSYSNQKHESYFEALKDFNNVFYLSSLAKVFPIAGLRAGWIATNVEKAQNYFESFLNAKMVSPISRKVLQTCLESHEFYRNQVQEIYDNREALLKVMMTYFEKNGVKSSLMGSLANNHGNFFSITFSNLSDIPQAISLLKEKGLLIRHKGHWNFIRVTSVGNTLLEKVSEELR